jgi:putative transposase
VKSTTVYQYRLRLPQTSWDQATAARTEAARLWNRMVKLHAWFRKRQLKWPSCGDFERHFKGRFALHSQTVQAIIQKFFAHIDGARTHRQNGNESARYPHRLRSHVNVVWKGQAVKVNDNRLTLPMGRGRESLSIRLPSIPDGDIAQAELALGRLLVTVNQEIADPQPGTGTVAADLGLIHLAVVTDGKKSLGVVGRGLRSLKQGHAKSLASISMLQARCRNGSRRWKKLQACKRKRSRQVQDRSRNLLHHAANAVIGFCVKQGAGALIVGDITEINRGKRGKQSKQLNQELGQLELGKLVQYLSYKGKLRGIELKTESERYTSQTCPACGAQHKPSGRRYVCDCGYTGVRDEVGAANLLNRHLNGKILPGKIVPQRNIRYLRPARLKTQRSVVVPLTPAMWLAWPGKGFVSSRDRSPAVASSRISRL